MKYIRTKNYIHNSKDVVVVNENGTLVVLRGVDKDFVERTRGRIWNTGTNVVLAQADTIEDLIDTLVVCFDNNIQPVLCGYSKFQSKLYAGDRGHIMGAIWTDKGLIYVARMNEKGEMVLL